MIIKVQPTSSVNSLVHYLYGPGYSNEHSNPHVVSGSEHVGVVQQMCGDSDKGMVYGLSRSLDVPYRNHGARRSRVVNVGGESKRVDWSAIHVVVSLAPGESLSSEQWGELSNDFARDFGLVGEDQEFRWVSVHHGLSSRGNDHVHLVASIIGDDGSSLDLDHYKYRCRDIRERLQQKYHLSSLGSDLDNVSSRGWVAGEARRAKEDNTPWLESRELKRIVQNCAYSAHSESEFVGKLKSANVLVRPRFAKDGLGVVGYSVKLSKREGCLWYGGGRLSKTLTLPQLRHSCGWFAESDMEKVRAWKGAFVKDDRSFQDPQQVAHRLQTHWDKVSVMDPHSMRWKSEVRSVAVVLSQLSSRFEQEEPGSLWSGAQALYRVSESRSVPPISPVARDAIRVAAYSRSGSTMAVVLATMAVLALINAQQRAMRAQRAAQELSRVLESAQAELKKHTTQYPEIVGSPVSNQAQRSGLWVENKEDRQEEKLVDPRVEQWHDDDGQLHREDGPARIFYNDDGSVKKEEWFYHGQEVEPPMFTSVFHNSDAASQARRESPLRRPSQDPRREIERGLEQ